MPSEHYFIICVLLVGIGVGMALGRRNVIAVLLGTITAASGVFVMMASLDAQNKTEGNLFALCFGSVLLVNTVLGCIIAYRHFKAVGTTNVDEENRLRH